MKKLIIILLFSIPLAASSGVLTLNSMRNLVKPSPGTFYVTSDTSGSWIWVVGDTSRQNIGMVNKSNKVKKGSFMRYGTRPGVYHMEWWGVDGTNKANHTKAMQMCHDAVADKYKKPIILMPGGFIYYDSLFILAGVTLEGVGGMTEILNRGGTVLMQRPGANCDGIRCYNPEMSPTSKNFFWHGRFANFSMCGDPRNAKGFAISLRQRDSDDVVMCVDNTLFENMTIRRHASGGMEFPNNGDFVTLRMIKFLLNGGPGVTIGNVYGRNTITSSMFHLDISGDGNKVGLVRLHNLGRFMSVTMRLKSESSGHNPFNLDTMIQEQKYAVVIDSCFNTFVKVEGKHISSADSLGRHRKPGDFFLVRGKAGSSLPILKYDEGLIIRVKPGDSGDEPFILRPSLQ